MVSKRAKLTKDDFQAAANEVIKSADGVRAVHV